MSEERARAEVYGRSGGLDEVVAGRTADHWAHRLAASQLGQWRPSNGLHLSFRTHEWLHRNPALAYAGGWHVRSGDDPRRVPVWLLRPWPGWWLIDDIPGDGGAHLLMPADVDLARPEALPAA